METATDTFRTVAAELAAAFETATRTNGETFHRIRRDAAIHGDKRPVRMHVRDHQSGVTFEGGAGLNPNDGTISFAAVVMPLAAD